MKICITALEPTEDSAVDQRFGRCKFFVFFDTQSKSFESIANQNIDAAGGAGIQSAQLMVSRGTDIVLTGSVGPNAFNVLSAAGVSIFTGASSSVKEAVAAYEAGKLVRVGSPNRSLKTV
jgi:predicted Fe-Mo cluster-binding NifX family protein